jgi:heat shock protein HtpX
MPSSPSLAGRAVLAVGLMLGFYILAVGIAGALLYIPYAEWTYAGHLHLKLALFCILGAGIILWSILPRLDRFIPPGPHLNRRSTQSSLKHWPELQRRRSSRCPLRFM